MRQLNLAHVTLSLEEYIRNSDNIFRRVSKTSYIQKYVQKVYTNLEDVCLNRLHSSTCVSIGKIH
jgi:hypothetical protein